MESSPEDHCIVKGALLSSWNHTLGPQLLYWWKTTSSEIYGYHLEACNKILNLKTSLQQPALNNEEQNSNVESSSVKQDSPTSLQVENDGTCSLHSYSNCMCVKDEDIFLKNADQMVGHLLLGELEHSQPYPEISSRLYCLPDKDLIMMSTVFSNKHALNLDGNNGENMFLCLVILFKKVHLDFVIDVYTLIDVMLRRATDLLLQFVTSLSRVVNPVTNILNELSVLLSSLYLASKTSAQIPPEVTSLVKNLDNFAPKVIKRALVSHLQTCGCSVVLGDSVNDVNKMVNLLLTFVNEEEHLCSRYAQLDKPCSYYSGLCIQGLLKDSSGQADVWFRDIMQNIYPTTVIDLNREKIRRTPLSIMQTLQERKRDKENEGDQNYLNASFGHVQSDRSALHTVTETGKIVPDLLQELEFLTQEDSKQEYVQCFTRCLQIKACALVKTREMCKGKREKIPFPRLARAVLGTTDETDLNIIASFAEKLRPGVAAYQWEKG